MRWLALLLISIPVAAFPQEQKCKEMGAACVCSEPLNTSDVPHVDTFYYDPNDVNLKECVYASGHPISRATGDDDMFATNDSAILGKLPGGHRINWVFRGSDDHAGDWYVGDADIKGASSAVRLAARWYMYKSEDHFPVEEEGLNCGQKMADLIMPTGRQFPSIIPAGAVQVYNWLSWTPAQDCCFSGPGPGGVTRSDWPGKWWRVEWVLSQINGNGDTNPGEGPIVQMYLKNITDGDAEIKVIDTSQSTASPTFSPTSDNRDPPSGYIAVVADMHRNGGEGVGGTNCDGYTAMSHYMAARWDADSGQRIRQAYEIESGSSDGSFEIWKSYVSGSAILSVLMMGIVGLLLAIVPRIIKPT